MQNKLKELKTYLIPEAFEMLEEGKKISEVRYELGHRIEPKLKPIFLNKLNFYVKKIFREKYELLKNILVLCFSLFFALMIYIKLLEFIKNPEIYSTFYTVLNLLMVFFFVNVIWKLYLWEGSYLRSVIVLMFIFSLGDLFELRSNYTNMAFMARLVLEVVSGAIAFYLYRKIFPTHGFMGAPKEVVKERNILDDFR